MRLIALTCVVMLAFAANSVLGRAAVGGGFMDAIAFGTVRLVSGAAVLVLLCWIQGRPRQRSWQQNLMGASSLTLYVVGFSLAYKDLDAGLGALVLFGVVQVTMFAWNAARGQRSGALQGAGAAMALAGLAYVVWPRESVQVDLWAAALMALSGLGWGAYSLLGKGARDPLVATAMNFLWASVFMLPVLFFAGGGAVVTAAGIGLGIVSGALTSGLGYALWYRILPQLQAEVAATVQLSVPIIAILAGAILLAEPVGFALIVGAVLVLGGIFLVIRAPRCTSIAAPPSQTQQH